MDTINLKNYQLDTIIKALNYNMPFAKGRVRNRFLIILSQKAQALEKNRLEMLTELSEKDAEGKPKIKDNSFELSTANQEKWTIEYAKMMEESCIIDVTPSIKGDLGTLKDIINTSKTELDALQTKVLEEVILAFEVTKPKKLPTKKDK